MTLFALSGMMFAVEMTEKIGIELPFTPAEFRDLLSLPNYIFGYILLIGVIIAIVRRLFVSEVREASIMYDWILDWSSFLSYNFRFYCRWNPNRNYLELWA